MSTDSSTASTGDRPLAANSEGLTGLRLGLASALGQLNSFRDGTTQLRDTYETFGWPTDPKAADYLALYLRNGYARAVVDKPALTTWRDAPEIVDDKEQESDPEFEADVERLADATDLWSYCTRVDRLAGIAEHGLLVLNLADTDGPEGFREDATEASLSGLDAVQGYRVYHQDQIDDIEWGGPADGDRWGKPVEYAIDLSEDVDQETVGEGGSLTVHWSRVIDVPATRLLDDETLARPRAEPVLNNLLDIEKTLGAVAEMAYRGADKGLHLNADPTKVSTSDQDIDDIEEKLQRWYHGLEPGLTTTGMEVQELGGEIGAPEKVVEPNLDAIAAQTGIPKRELRGNQQGEQAGAKQDEKSYFGTISERREQYATPHIVRAVIDRLRALGVLPEPAGDGYTVDWPDLTQLSAAEEADLQQSRSTVVKNIQTVVPDLRGERAETYVEEGEFPDREDAAATPAGNDRLDESDPTVRAEFERLTGVGAVANATQYQAGEWVSTPDGKGVIDDAVAEGTVDGMDASSDAPVYAVAMVDEATVNFYRAGDLEKVAAPDVDVTDPASDILKANSREPSTLRGLLRQALTANDWSMPPSWRKADTPARVILLDAWASMGGTFRGARQELGSKRLAAAMKDAVLGTEEWGGGWAE